jgi:hypothetical protein
MGMMRSIFRFPAENDWTSWHALWRVVILIGVFYIMASNATDETSVAKKERTGLATIKECNDDGKGASTFCHYVFSADGQDYTGASRVPLGVFYSQNHIVYYEADDPGTSSLKDFSESARQDWNMTLGVGLISVLLFGIVLYSNLVWRDRQNQRSS